jgi:hypothetical protein
MTQNTVAVHSFSNVSKPPLDYMALHSQSIILSYNNNNNNNKKKKKKKKKKNFIN